MRSLISEPGVVLHDHSGQEVSVEMLLEKAAQYAYSVCDPTGMVLEVNSPYEDMYGYTKEELLGKPFTVVVPEAQRETLMTLFKQFFEGREELPQQYTVMGKDGSLSTVRVSAYRVSHPAKGVLKLTLIEQADPVG